MELELACRFQTQGKGHLHITWSIKNGLQITLNINNIFIKRT